MTNSRTAVSEKNKKSNKMEIASKAKRQIKGPYKKWAKNEEEKLVFFLRENLPIEKPTAQAYYRRYMQQNKIDGDWNLIRCKVRNMRQSYQKVKSWQNSTGAGALREGQTIEDVILKKCPLFNELEDVFGYKEPAFTMNTIDTESWNLTEVLDATCSRDSVNQTESEIEAAGVNSLHSERPAAETDMHFAENDLQLGTAEPENMIPSKSRKGIYSRTALSDIMQMQEKFMEIKGKKIDVEIEMKEKELELQKERFLFDKQSRLDELKLKDKEIESNEKLKIMELQMKERIALKELEMKERIEVEKLKLGK